MSSNPVNYDKIKNVRNSFQDFVKDKNEDAGVLHAQIDFGIGLLSSSPSVVFSEALFFQDTYRRKNNNVSTLMPRRCSLDRVYREN